MKLSTPQPEVCMWGVFKRYDYVHLNLLTSQYAKITPTRKLNPYAFMKEIGVVSRKFPPREMSYQHFREIFPSENNHVYSTLY